jgi:leucyl aminopeptidase (aminopeptidase T)
VAGAAASTVDHRALAARVVAQMQLLPGERVLLLAGPAEPPERIAGLRSEVARAGGTSAVRAAGSEGALPDFDVAVALPGASSTSAAYRAAHAALSGRRRAVHFHWRGLDPSPSAWALPGHPLPADAVIDRVYEAAVLGSDCAALGDAMRTFASALRRDAVRVSTPLGTDLRFEVRDRPVNVQDGDASAARAERARVRVDRDVEIPCGVLRVAPVEETVSGVIVFPPARWDGREIARVKMTFDKGRVVAAEAAGGQGPAVEAELARGGAGARSFREFALGFNPALAVPAREPWIPYYGYGAGVVRLSLGDNTELGGSVGGGYVRWNFFTDATVEVGRTVWVRSGALQSR